MTPSPRYISIFSHFLWARRNLLSNVVGQGWIFLVGIVLTPVFIRFLGLEAYGFLSFVFLLSGIFRAFDFGLLTTSSREIAKLNQPEENSERADLFRTLETAFFWIALSCTAVLIAAAPLISTRWLITDKLSDQGIVACIAVAGVMCAFQLLSLFYYNCLLGIERQVTGNFLKAFEVTASGISTILLLVVFKAGLLYILIGNTIISALVMLAGRLSLTAADPELKFGKSSRARLFKLSRFAGGIAVIGFLSIIATSMERVVISKLMPITMLGYFNVSVIITMAFNAVVISPFFSIALPRLTRLAHSNDFAVFARYLRILTQAQTLFATALAAFIWANSTQVVWLWSRNQELADNAGPLISVMIFGSVLNGWSCVLYAYQLARADTSVAVVCNLVIAILSVTLGPLLIVSHGLQGGAAMWPISMFIYFVLSVWLTYRHFSDWNVREWIFSDLLVPSISVLATFLLLHIPGSFFFQGMSLLVLDGVSLLLALVVGFQMSPAVRNELISAIRSSSEAKRV